MKNSVVHRSSGSVYRSLLPGLLLLLMFFSRAVVAESAFCDINIDEVVVES